MSNSERAQERRRRRSHMAKHQRSIMAQQHWGDSQGSKRESQHDSDTKLASILGLLKR